MINDATRLGKSSEIVRRIAFGCEQLGGHAWGAVDRGRIERAIELAIECGIRIFDTADCYGHGESERRLGRVVSPYRDRVLLATKFGVRFTDSGRVFHDSSPEWAQEALDASLRRLGTEAVDLFQVHYWDGVTSLEALFEKLERLRERQKIRWYGISNHVPSRAQLAYPGLATVSLEYSLAHRETEAAARRLSSEGVAFLSYGSLGQGILTGKYLSSSGLAAGDRRSSPRYVNFHGDVLARNLRVVDALTSHARAIGTTPAQLAIAWILHALPGSVPLVGIKDPAQFTDAAAALTLRLESDVMVALDSVSRAAPERSEQGDKANGEVSD